MMRHYLTLVFLLLIFFSCNNSTETNCNEIIYDTVLVYDTIIIPNPEKKKHTETYETTPFGTYQIRHTNYYEDSTIVEIRTFVRNYIDTTFKPQTILELLETDTSSIGNNPTIIANEYSGIRGPSIFYNLKFISNEEIYQMRYCLRFKKVQKETFWLLSPPRKLNETVKNRHHKK